MSAPESEPQAARALTQAIRDGNSNAETALVDRYGPGLRFLTLRLTNGNAHAEDLYQDTVKLVIEKVRGGALRKPESLAAFTRQVAKNLAIAEYRKQARHPTAETDPEALAASNPGPSTTFEAEERAGIVRQVLGELSQERDREVLFRFYIDQVDKERICAELDLSSEAFNQVLFRARNRFRKLWKARQTGQGG